MRQELGVSERRACRTLGQHRSTQRKVPLGRADEERLTDDIIELANTYGRYGYRMVTGLLNNAGWHVNHKRVERIWRREGLKVPQKQKKKGRLWLNDGSCVRLRPERPNHVWSYDFVQDRTSDGRVYRTLNIIDEYTREALMIRVDRKLNSTDVLDTLTDLFILRGTPEYIRSDNGPEFIAHKVRDWIAAVGGQDGLHRARVALGERLLRKLQCPVQGRTVERRTVLQSARGKNPDRAMASSLQHRKAAQLAGVSSSSTGKHRDNGPKADDALTIKPDHPIGARHFYLLLRALPHAKIRLFQVKPLVSPDTDDFSIYASNWFQLRHQILQSKDFFENFFQGTSGF